MDEEFQKIVDSIKPAYASHGTPCECGKGSKHFVMQGLGFDKELGKMVDTMSFRCDTCGEITSEDFVIDYEAMNKVAEHLKNNNGE